MSAFEMDEPFDLPVEYQGRETMYPARLVKRGYSYKIHVEADGQEVIFELDEERNFRAIFESADKKPIRLEIVKAIGEALEKHLR